MKWFRKKRPAAMLAALLLSVLLFTTGAAAGRAVTIGEYLYGKLQAVAELVETESIYSYPGDDPVKHGLTALFEQYPWMFDVLADMMLGSYDRYSGYYDENTYAALYGEESDYVGIGVTVELDTMGVRVIAVAEDSAAENAGIRPGDYIVSAGDTQLSGKDINAVSAALRGEAGTAVDLVVRRPGRREYLNLTLTRTVVKHRTVFYKRIGDVAYISISTFAPGTDEEFAAAVDAACADGARGVIYDLRQNLGGDLDTLIRMLDHIVPEKDVTMFGLKTREGEEQIKSSGGGRAFEATAVLVDAYTASSSEIFTYALRELGIATVIGAKTYGKGVGQSHYMFYDGSVVVLTALEVTFPSGTTYHGKGIAPDINAAVEYEDIYGDDILIYPEEIVLHAGDKSDYVGVLEYYLKILGFFGGEPDFVFDADTLDAYNDFQRLCGLKETGETNAETNRRLIAAAQYELDTASVEKDLALEKALELLDR